MTLLAVGSDRTALIVEGVEDPTTPFFSVVGICLECGARVHVRSVDSRTIVDKPKNFANLWGQEDREAMDRHKANVHHIGRVSM